MNTDHGLKVGDKIKSPRSGFVYDVLEVESRLALVKNTQSGEAFPIVCDDGVWCARIGGHPWTVVKPRWQAVVEGSVTLIYDGGRDGYDYAVALWSDDTDTDLTRSEVAEFVEAIVDLLNERFPA